ncbi:phosphatidylserine decarboxylase [Parasphingorhabdus cellanae]|uniref:Phosphatidylserine decarboxylase proenzyme n=1 Tax=Parasphingorhabdus cellanae TaxID=2806553 RepID=A0ABX7T7K6_9SPHN|nr:phosphatidylserine decarboxylase [Parasphingorhabdus cellanae]QTD55918.1 phosphatidylserine decarboxylase [Parasphingorhabdus cellanae]
MAIEKYSNKGLGEAKWSFPPVHPEGRKFAVISAAITAAFAFFAWETLAWPMAGITIWVLAFFRDPKRVTPLDDKYIVAPADGLVNLIMPVVPPVELQGDGGLGDEELIRVSIFMSVFDVHINRTPIEGTVKRQAYISGKFLNADLDKASDENERQHFMVERNDGLKVGFTQIAGLVARRIMSFVKEGDFVAVGQRIGLIRFGSRVDVYLPKGTTPNVVLGQRTIAGETVIAEIGQMKEIEGIGQ